MKIVFTFCIAAFLIGCVKEKTPTTPLNEMVTPQTIKVYSGNFTNGPYGSVAGKAHIIRDSTGAWKLQLDSLNSSNGPDLKVYVSKEIQPQNFINLGALRSINGTQLYDIDSTLDFSAYKYALIHCQAYNHLFGSALLTRN